MTKWVESAAVAPLLAWGTTLRAARLRRRRIAQHGIVLACGIALIGATIAVPPAPRLVWNVSASAPIGLYAVSPGMSARRGDMVIARMPLRYREFAATRGYLPRNVPLVKRVAGVGGDRVCATGETISVDGSTVAERSVADPRGRPLPHWSGCADLRNGQSFLLMDDTPASFDGRYFGVTDPRDVVGRAWLLWRR